MNSNTIVGVWVFLIISAVLEVMAFYSAKGFTLYVALGILAFTMAIVSALFSMDLKDESRPIKYLFLIPVVLVFILFLAITTTYSLP